MLKQIQILQRLLVFSLIFMSFITNAQTTEEKKLEQLTAGQKTSNSTVVATKSGIKNSISTPEPVIRLRYPVPVPAGWPAPIAGSSLGVIHMNLRNGNYTISSRDWLMTVNAYTPAISNVAWAGGKSGQLVWQLPQKYRNQIISNNKQDAILTPIMQASATSTSIIINYCDGVSGGTCSSNNPNFQYEASLSALSSLQLVKTGSQGAGTYSFIGCTGDTSDQVKDDVLNIIGGSRYIICCFKQNPTTGDSCTLK